MAPVTCPKICVQLKSEELNGSRGKYWGNYVLYIGHNLFYFNNILVIFGCRPRDRTAAAPLKLMIGASLGAT